MNKTTNRMKRTATFFLTALLLAPLGALALDYPHQTAEPQKTGWPLTAEERAYITEKAEHDRRPGRESNKHLPQLWPQVPSAGFFGGDAWLKLHEAHVKTVQANQGPCDVLLVGDSITIQWGESWKKNFPDLKAVNIGIGGDKTQNVLWRLDHGGVEGLQPKAIVLMIGNNNMFFTPETGIEAAAKGIVMCVKNLREKFPATPIIVAKILPAHAPGNRFHEDIKKTNTALDPLKLDSDPQVRVLDLWSDFTNADGTIKKDLFTPDNIHLSPAGYAVYAKRLKPLLEAVFSGKPMPAAPAMPAKASAAPAPGKSAESKPAAAAPKAASGIVLPSKPVLTYAYAPYNEGKLDPQITGWPLSAEELAWVTKGEYTRKPGHDAQKHLPEMWPITPTAARWGEAEANPWIEHHAQCIEKVQAMKDGIDIMLIGDSITQGWGGGWDGAPFNAAWQKHFGDKKTVNLGIGGDRTEGVLWRLDHGAVEGASPKTIVLMIGVNNSNGVQANGVPVSAAVEGIRLCVANLRARCPDSRIVLVKILPAFDPAKEVGAKVREMNAALDGLKLESDAKVRVLDLWADFTKADGTIKTELYSDGHLHLGPAGYEVFASRLKPVVGKVLLLMPMAGAAAEPVNVARGRLVKADSVRTKETPAALAVDGVATDESRWLSAEKPGPHWLEVDLGAERKLGGAHLYSGWEGTSALKNFELQAWGGEKWISIEGSARSANTEPALALKFRQPVTTSKVRLWINDNGSARVAELLLWENLPALGAGVGPTSHPVMVNQIGYNLDWPKRFTAPLLERGTFTLAAVGSEEVLHRGEVRQGVGDFTGFRPTKFDAEYVITVSGGDLEPGKSDPFRVSPFRLQSACLAPALQFWIDDRGVVGSIPSAMGAAPWRDGPYYNFDTPSLVLLYLANPAFFEHLPVEMNWARDKARVTDPAFKLKKPQGPSGDWNSDENALEIARRYYTELDAPVGERVPDIIQCIHWGVSWWRLKPACFDYADDPAGHRIHPQTISSFAFFLYAHPFMKQYFTEKFYADIRDFALAQWRPAGLFEVNKTIGTFKGRECPGYSILPNLLMYEVAKRDRLPNAEDFFQAAYAQTKWVVDDLDFNDPRVTKGQRMSEHKLMMGLVTFQREYPERAPAGLRRKIEQWAQIMVARSQNMWDFRKYDAQNWTLPKNDPSQDNSHGGAGWNEPGNLAGFPALALSVADLLTDKTQAQRLREVGVAQFDALFGRNPVGAASAWRMPSDFPGVDRGWPKHFPDGICAALETVRGTLNSSASGEHYPFNPRAAFRHPEGWSAFNAAFNVGLAVACQTETAIKLLDPATGKPLSRVKRGQPLLVRLQAPFGPQAREIVLQWETSGGQRGELRLTPGTHWEATARVTWAETGGTGDGRLVVPKGENLTLSYGLGFMRHAVKWQHDPASSELRLGAE